MKIKKKFSLNRLGNEIHFERNQETGLVHIEALTQNDFSYGLGYLHAHDRFVQMEMLRIISKGELSERFKDNDETFSIDCFMRQLGLSHEAKKEVSKLSHDELEYLNHYCEGINHYQDTNRRPLEFILIGHVPKKWEPEDTLSTIKVMSYIGLAQTQQDIEKLIIELVKENADIEKLKSIFSPHLDELEQNKIALIKKLRIKERTLPKEIRLLKALPKIMASNNWVISGELSSSNSPIQCNDPHLECNRLPAIWYEFSANVKELESFCGISMPGVPGLIMGRTEHLSFGFTYGFMDMIDYFIEEVRSNTYRSEDEFIPFKMRREIIKRKSHHDVEFFIRQTDNGVLECDGTNPILSKGHYLSYAWSCYKDGAADSLRAIKDLLTCKTVEDFQNVSSKVTISCNWLVADNKGNIGYQQSGRLPVRNGSGLCVNLGHKKAEQWQGIHEASKLSRFTNPSEKMIITANNDIHSEGAVKAINMPMGDYRKRRIEELLEQMKPLDTKKMQAIQNDLVSIQAREYIEVIKKEEIHLDDENIKKLLAWDYRYNKESKEAVFFEKFYTFLLEGVFTESFLTKESFQYLKTECSLFVDYYKNFDDIIFNEDPLWFAKRSRKEFFLSALQMTVEYFKENELLTWGQVNNFKMTNIFFDGALPEFLGFDSKEIPIEGNRATIVQGAVYRAHGRQSSFCPSYRMISDLSTKEMKTVLAGGVSGNRFSKYYQSDVEMWLNGKYKTLTLK